ncbi:helix-turn-helix transcriptional regulator [Arthrobacter sp.]|uniref:helix-turn-helix domain-containing protein n=1 Tax=Arthrobacter sp. TaxID=1667 RepID=UPI00338F22DB
MSHWSTSESDFHRALAAKLSDVRTKSQTSQGTLASELGVDQAAVSRVESGRRRLSVGETFAWLEALGFDADSSSALLRDLWVQYGTRPPGFWKEPIGDG